MTFKNFFNLPVGLLALLASPAFAQLPYNPARIITSLNSSLAYIFSPQPASSQYQLSRLDISDIVDSSNPPITTIYPSLPFLSASSSNAFLPLVNDEGDISVLSGNCSAGADGAQLWRFVPDSNWHNGTWSRLSLTSEEAGLGPEWLSAGMSFSPTASASDASLYIFGGMCPVSTSPAASTVSSWTLNADYSNNMLTISPDPLLPEISASSSPYDLSMSSSRGPPIAEAGLTITPLVPTYSNTSSVNISQQQNFVLLGGHTQQAFINMSQVALFSLPQSSWSFLGVDSAPEGGNQDLLTRDSNSGVEPRSGHTAMLTPDGSKIIVVGGWVGDVNTPANPQLTVLNVGQGYGGSGDWTWSTPSVSSDPFHGGQGIYGHGAAVLPGGIMMITGGYSISGSGLSKHRRTQNSQTANTQLLLFNMTSSSWVSSYTNPSSPNSPAYTGTSPGSGGALKTSAQKAGLGAGLAMGLSAIAGVLAVWLLYSRRLRHKRALREKELRELALGADGFHSSSLVGGGMDGRGGTAYPEVRSASWGSRQERRLGTSSADEYPWAPVSGQQKIANGDVGREGNGQWEAERTGLLVEIPSPTRGLRKSLNARGVNGYGAGVGMSVGPPSRSGRTSSLTGGIHRIDEAEEEGSQPGSIKRKAVPAAALSTVGGRPSRYSDPFKDPPPPILPQKESLSDEARKQREREVKGWVDDWSVAAAAMDRGELDRSLSKSTGHTHTFSSLSDSHSASNSAGTRSGRGSPDKSDRTGSNLSERSTMSTSSIQRSVFGSVSRNVSLRSSSAGYALFAGAAAAMAAKVTGGGSSSAAAEQQSEAKSKTSQGQEAFKVLPRRMSSNRSASLNTDLTASSFNYPKPRRDRSETFATAQTSLAGLGVHPAEGEALLSGMNSRAVADERERERDSWATPPESPVKWRPGSRDGSASVSGSLGQAAGRKALGFLGSMKRALTGTGDVAVKNIVAEFENRSNQSSPTKEKPEMSEVEGFGPKRAASASSAVFLRGKRGARDWDADHDPPPLPDLLSGSPTFKTRKDRFAPGGGVRAVAPREDVGSDEEDDVEWDVEAAVQRRVVQVMFTVPKEKLRVVNADALSLLSKSDVDFEGGEREDDTVGDEEKGKRISVVPEEVEGMAEGDVEGERVDEKEEEQGQGKGKERGKGKEVLREPVKKYIFED